LKEETIKLYIWSTYYCGAETGDTLESRSEIPGKFEMWCWRRMEKISWTDHVKNGEVSHRVKKQRNILHTVKIRKANLIGDILRRNCFLKHVFEGKREGTERQGIRHKQQLGKLKDIREYGKLEEEAPDCTVWGTGLEMAMDMLYNSLCDGKEGVC
jgi:hypothetical protein